MILDNLLQYLLAIFFPRVNALRSIQNMSVLQGTRHTQITTSYNVESLARRLSSRQSAISRSPLCSKSFNTTWEKTYRAALGRKGLTSCFNTHEER